MEKYELPLVFFTVLSQMSVGMALVLTWRTLRGEVAGPAFLLVGHWAGAGTGVYCRDSASGASRSRL